MKLLVFVIHMLVFVVAHTSSAGYLRGGHKDIVCNGGIDDVYKQNNGCYEAVSGCVPHHNHGSLRVAPSSLYQ